MATLYRTLTGQSQRSQHGKQDGLTPTSTHQPPDLSRMTTTNTQTGVLNHLTEQQEHKLHEFKERLQRDGWWSPNGVNGKPTHDDGTLLRYLRARKFDVQGAIGQFTDTEKWLKEQRVEELYEHFDVDFYERARLMYPQWTGHRDRRGIPIYVYEIKGLDSKSVERYQKESAAYKAHLPTHKDLPTAPKLLPLFALYHNLLNFVLPFVSTLERPRPEVPVTNSTNIVDISGVSLRQFWNLKNHMQDASVLATAHYPETLDRIFIIGAPTFFPTVWGWIKRWFDPVTVSKIFILSKADVKPTLEKFMDPSCFPKKYGGTLDWNSGDVPHLDDETRAALERDGNKGWVKGPALWLNNERVVVGSENGKLRRSDQDIAQKKPVVYAADYTEEPVHPEKRASIISGYTKSGSLNSASGSLVVKTVETRAPTTEAPTLVDEHLGAAGAAAAAAGAAVAASATTQASEADQQTMIPSNINPKNILTSPMGDSQVHLPEAQAALPAQTAEYISPTNSNTLVPATASQAPAAATATAASQTSPSTTTATAAAAILASIDPSVISAPVPPPGHTQPGRLSTYQTEVNAAVAQQLHAESTVAIPAEANGAPPHPELVSASDPAKGLAVEADKIVLAEKTERPQPERFVTAMEVLH